MNAEINVGKGFQGQVVVSKEAVNAKQSDYTEESKHAIHRVIREGRFSPVSKMFRKILKVHKLFNSLFDFFQRFDGVRLAHKLLQEVYDTDNIPHLEWCVTVDQQLLT